MGGNLHLRLLAPEPPRPGDAPRGHPRCRTAALGEGLARAPRCRPRLAPAPGAERAGEPSALARACGRCYAGAASPGRRAAATRERREREEMHTRELGLGWRQYILAEAPARFWADGQNGTRTTDHESDGQNFFCYRGHAGVASWPQRIYSLDGRLLGYPVSLYKNTPE